MKTIVLAMFALILTAQTTTTYPFPAMQPGDVLYFDPATSRAYLWLHKNTGYLELLPPFTQEQAFKLLLDREQSCQDNSRQIINSLASSLSDYVLKTRIGGYPGGNGQ